ncbi:MAG: magnesium transporter [Rhodospirillales bacterium]|nr:magnesium transporter [Rhodospirillales bacterium]MDE0711540.1 magnesium transporter [Rhodospirillales bacterium]
MPESQATATAQEQRLELISRLADAGTEPLASDLAQLRASHPADLADIIEQLPSEPRLRAVHLLGEDLPADSLASLSRRVLDRVASAIDPGLLARLTGELETDDAAYVLECLDEARRARLLKEMPASEAELARQALEFQADSAGRIMQRDYVAIPSYWTIGQVIDHLRDSPDIPDEFYALFVVGARHTPVGTIPLHRAMRTHRDVRVADIMTRDPKVVQVNADREDVAFVFDQYELTSAPVVDAQNRLIGMVTVDDVVDVIQEEASEDMMRLAGVGPEHDIYTAAFQTARNRFNWLLINLFTAFLASAAIAVFASTIEQVVALAVLMPIVASMGGNAGMQTLTVAVRAIATRELTPANAARVLGKEVLVGLCNGVAFAVLTGLGAGLWFSSVPIGLVIGAAMIFNMVVAGLFGALVPMMLERARVDPAHGAAVILTTVTDVVGFFAFLGLAQLTLL